MATSDQWGNNDLAVEWEIARVLVIDEYTHDAVAALAALEEADKRYQSDRRLVRQRAKVHYRQDDHAAVLEAFEPTIPR